MIPTSQKINKINNPSHYTYGDIEVIDFVEQVTKEYPSNISFSVGNAIKYLSRAPYKNAKEDIEKAIWYLNRVVDKWDVK